MVQHPFRRILVLVVLTLGLANATTTIWSSAFPPVASLLLGLDPSKIGRAAGETQLVIEVARVLGALAAVLFWSQKASPNWISVGFLFIACSYGLVVMSSDTPTYFTFRIIGELGRTWIFIACFAVVNEFVTESRRAKANMLIHLSIGILIAAGLFAGRSIFAGVDSVEGLRESLFLVCGCYLIFGSVFALLVKKPFGLLYEHQSSKSSNLAEPLHSLSANPKIALSILAMAIGSLAVTMQTNYFTLWMLAASHEAELGTAKALAKASAQLIWQNLIYIFSAIAFGLLADRLNRLLLLLSGLLILGGAYVAIGFANDPLGVLSINLFRIYAIGAGAVLVCGMTLLTQETPKRRMVRSIGLSVIVSTVIIGIGTFIGGELFDRYGGAAPFLFSGATALVLFAFAVRIYRRSPGPSAAEYRSPNYQPQSGRA